MKTAIRQRARELGFDDCRFATAAPPESAPAFLDWLRQRRHGEMGYLERNATKRVEPDRVLAGAKTVIALAVSYGSQRSEDRGQKSVGGARASRATERVSARVERQGESEIERRGPSHVQPEDRVPHPTPAGVIARYAQFADYHDVLGARLKDLTAFIGALGGAGTRSLWYVDTGPVLERDVAQRAGIGFVGKHTNVISRRFGNWIFLSEILTTLALEPDPPEKNRCGTCTRCLAACPTGAIVAPFQLDARLCISYLTIELKGSIPVELRPKIGLRIFGCDDCLAACPWNRFAREGTMMRANARPDLATPDLIELLALDDAGFKARFSGTPMLRARRRGFLRNVCVALGNAGDASALPALERAATDPEPLVAEHARWAIERIRKG